VKVGVWLGVCENVGVGERLGAGCMVWLGRMVNDGLGDGKGVGNGIWPRLQAKSVNIRRGKIIFKCFMAKYSLECPLSNHLTA